MRIITKDDILKGMNDGIIKVIYRYGIVCMVGNYYFYFDGGEGDDYDCLEDFLADYSQEEIAEQIEDTINNIDSAWKNGIEEDEWNYMYNFLHRADNQQEDYITMTLSYVELGLLKELLGDKLDDLNWNKMQNTDIYRETEIFYKSLVRK